MSPVLDGGDHGAQAQVDARLGVPGGGVRADLAERGGQRGAGGLDDGHGAARPAGGGGHLGADPARADDGDPGPLAEQGTQPERVVDGAHHVLGAVSAQPDRAGAGGDDQAVVGQFALGGLDHAGVQSLGGHTRAEVDLEGVEVGVDDSGVGLAEQHPLGQGRTVIGPVPLLSDQGDPAAEPTGP